MHLLLLLHLVVLLLHVLASFHFHGFRLHLHGMKAHMLTLTRFLLVTNMLQVMLLFLTHLFLVQLWYDAFMLDEAVYNNIVSNYKTLRKENVVFPPRLPNEKNLISVKTESPIM